MKINLKNILSDYLYIAAGSFILAMGMNMFLVPLQLSSGGVGTVGTVLLHLFKIPLSVTNLFFNVVLFLAGYKYLEKTSVGKTVAGIIFLSFSLEITKHFSAFNDDLFISTVVGGILVGIGIGAVIRVEASTGGSDFAALILKRFIPYMSAASIIFIIDCVIIAFAGIVFKSYTITFYSLTAMFISSKVADAIMAMGDAAKSVLIISGKNGEIAQMVMDNFERGITGIYSKGLYSKEDNLMLLCVVSPKELPRLMHSVRELDSDAFAMIFDTREVLGEGFKTKTAYDKIYTGN